MKTFTTQTGVWIDRSRAVIVTFSGDNEGLTCVKSGIENGVHHKKEGQKGSFIGAHHINHEKKWLERKKHETENFLNKVLEQLSGADKIYVFGPSKMKIFLKKKIESGNTISADKLKGVDTAGEMTDNQIKARVREFYHISAHEV